MPIRDGYSLVNMTGLGTFSNIFTCVTPGVYTVQGQLQIPTLTNGGGASACQVVVKKNSSTSYTGTAGASGFSTVLTLAAGDTVSVVTSSSNAADQPLNVIQIQAQVFMQI